MDDTGKSRIMKSWFFIADAHLSGRDSTRQELLIRFLKDHLDQMECLVVLGDLFEFWFGFPGYVDPAYRPLCNTLISLRKRGVRLICLEGNHEFSLGPFFTGTLHSEVYPGSHVLDLNGLRVFLAHGDGLDRWDLRYRLYRALFKNRIIYTLIRLLGPRRALRVKNLISGREWMHRRRKQHPRRLAEERFAREKCRQGMDVVILAHTHQPGEKTFLLDGRTCSYFNIGDWIEHFSYLRYHPESGFRLQYYRSDGPHSQERAHTSPDRMDTFRKEAVSPE